MDYVDCEKMANIVLRHNKLPVTDENIGIVIDFILRANHKYNKNIGNEYGFRKSYIDFAIKSIKTLRKKRFLEKTIYVDDFTKIKEDISCTDFNSDLFWEDLEKKLTSKEFSAILGRVKYSKTLREISEENGFSIETARNYIKSASRKIKKWYN
jgi:hypothetical protein